MPLCCCICNICLPVKIKGSCKVVQKKKLVTGKVEGLAIVSLEHDNESKI